MLADPAGAKQTSFMGKKYAGPCPSGQRHNYQFTLYALDTATISALTQNSDQNAASTQMTMHMVKSTTLLGWSDAQ